MNALIISSFLLLIAGIGLLYLAKITKSPRDSLYLNIKGFSHGCNIAATLCFLMALFMWLEMPIFFGISILLLGIECIFVAQFSVNNALLWTGIIAGILLMLIALTIIFWHHPLWIIPLFIIIPPATTIVALIFIKRLKKKIKA